MIRGKGFLRRFAPVFGLVFCGLILRTFLLQAFWIPSGSMEKTFLKGDFLFVNKAAFGLKIPFSEKWIFDSVLPRRGDVIVFEYPGEIEQDLYGGTDFIKRVIGQPGDRVEIKKKQVFVNGKPYSISEEIHADPSILPREDSPRDFFGPVVVPEGQYLVLGDNRDFSFDSREWGFVPRNKIKGSPLFLYWSWDDYHHSIRWDRIGTFSQ